MTGFMGVRLKQRRMVIKDAYGLFQYRAFKEWLEGRVGKVNATIRASEAVELLGGPADWAAFGLDPKNVEQWRQKQLGGGILRSMSRVLHQATVRWTCITQSLSGGPCSSLALVSAGAIL